MFNPTRNISISSNSYLQVAIKFAKEHLNKEHKFIPLSADKLPSPLICLQQSNTIKGAAFGAYAGAFNVITYGTFFLVIAYVKSYENPNALENFSINNAFSLIMHAAKTGAAIGSCVGAFADIESIFSKH